MNCYITRSDRETRAMARALEPHLQSGDLLLLSGDLATGKTTFVQGLAEAMGVERRVTSPTFTLLQSYRGRLELHHLDLYRLKNPQELLDVALPELLETPAVIAIEWPELLLQEIDVQDFLRIHLGFIGSDEREVRFEFHGDGWRARQAIVEAGLTKSRERY
jgi:tRNA threonylcarbamoyladenosine biosynthesis protein TsaE